MSTGRPKISFVVSLRPGTAQIFQSQLTSSLPASVPPTQPINIGISSQSHQAISNLRAELCLGENREELAFQLPPPVQDDYLADDVRMPDFEDNLNDIDFRAFLHDVRDMTQSRWRSKRYRRDDRTWADRLARLQKNWEPLMPKLAEAYLVWRGDKDMHSCPDKHSMELDDGGDLFPVIDLYHLRREIVLERFQHVESIPEELVLNSLIPNTPVNPSIAITIPTLEFYHRLRRRHSSFSIQSFVKVLCDFYGHPYRRRYYVLFAEAFDVYLSILRIIDGRVLVVLGRADEDWRPVNGCAGCGYELEDKDELNPRRMMAMDGNNSLKNMIRTNATDKRHFASKYYLPASFVNKFAHEVHRTTIPAPGSQEFPLPEVAEGTNDDFEANAAESAPPSHCTDNWKAAAADTKKRMWSIFANTGIFASACRHGQILWIVDMIQSGELAKYPLATVAKALEVLGPNLLIGYDIGCSFETTITNSSLGPKFEESGSRCCVNAFHAAGHSWDCQRKNNHGVIPGAGLEDLEVFERVFSSSNSVARLTRHASAFHRHQFIDLHFQQWDEDKYLNIGTFLLNNVSQALKILETDRPALKQALESFNITETDLQDFQKEQNSYAASLEEGEDSWDAHTAEYVELLRQLESARHREESTRLAFVNSTPEDYKPFARARSSQPASQTTLSGSQKLAAERRIAVSCFQRLEDQMIELEVAMGITRRWTPQDPEYINTVAYLSNWNYLVKLDELQRLVVQRIFELSHLNIADTGYKMREHIGKSLKRRSAAVQKATKDYNEAALACNPPRATVDWERVSHYEFLEDFALLRETREEILQRPWTKPAIQFTMKQALRIKRAEEELKRCAIEIRRVLTHIQDENELLDACLEDLRSSGDPLLVVFDDFVCRRKLTNAHIHVRLLQACNLPGFICDSSIGIRKGSGMVRTGVDRQEPVTEGREIDLDDRASTPGLEEDDETSDRVGAIVDYLGDASTQ